MVAQTRLSVIMVGLFSTFGPAPGSVEEVVYTTVPAGLQLAGLGEVLVQALLLSVLLFYWARHPEKRWLTWLLTACFVIVITLSALGYFLA